MKKTEHRKRMQSNEKNKIVYEKFNNNKATKDITLITAYKRITKNNNITNICKRIVENPNYFSVVRLIGCQEQLL